MEDNPIREPETLFEKFRKRFKKKKHEIVIATYNPYRDKNYNISQMGDAWTKFGITAEEASERIMKFSKILTPNEMRELIERRKQW